MSNKSEEVGPDHPCWPEVLSELSDPPASLHLLGTLPPLERAVALVGTRAADPEAMELSHLMARDLCQRGCVVISGGALGVDAAAHRGALEAGGRTLVVLASGFAPPYPTGHRSLFDAVVERDGALLSEHPDGTPPLPGRFIERNRIVAALARVVVVVQAPARSGALSTARRALTLGRDVLAVPAAPWDPRGVGCLALLRQGARVCTGVEDVLSLSALGGGKSPLLRQTTDDKATAFPGLDDDARTALQSLGGRPRHPDELSLLIGWPLRRVQRALVSLELSGAVELRSGGRYARRSRRR